MKNILWSDLRTFPLENKEKLISKNLLIKKYLKIIKGNKENLIPFSLEIKDVFENIERKPRKLNSFFPYS